MCGADCRTFDVICAKGVVKVCSDCIKKENLPLVRKPVELNFRNVEKKQPIYERLSRISGIKLGDIREKDMRERKLLTKQDEELRKLVEGQSIRTIDDAEAKEKLIDNFHWVIMRVRRLKKLTKEQLAKEIGESEDIIKLLEQGVIPAGYIPIISKIESVLNVRIFREEPEKSEQVEFNHVSTKQLTIADLKEMKEERERRIFEPEKAELNERREEYILDENTDEDKPEFRRKKDIIQDEMDRIIFGK